MDRPESDPLLSDVAHAIDDYFRDLRAVISEMQTTSSPKAIAAGLTLIDQFPQRIRGLMRV
jgi:hypothetical protein